MHRPPRARHRDVKLSFVSIRNEREKRGYILQLLSHTLSRKNLLALTGLFLCFFLVIHLFGNLQLLLPVDVARWQFNFYSKLLSENILIQIISYVLFASILAHVVYALVITVHNKRSSGKRYEYDRRSVSSKWYARKMGLLGTILLFFLDHHLRDFWSQLQFGHVPFRATAFPIKYDLKVDRSAFDRIIQAAGYISASTGGEHDSYSS